MAVKPDLSSVQGQSYDVDYRMRLLTNELTRDQRNGWKSLEEATGISKEKWRQFNRGSTKASVEMLQALALEWPQFAFWLATGVSDEKHGHFAPTKEFAWPGEDDDVDFSKQSENYKFTVLYFKKASKAVQGVFKRLLALANGGDSVEDKYLEIDLEHMRMLHTSKYREFLANNSEISSQFETEDWLHNSYMRDKALIKEFQKKKHDD